MSTRFYDTDLTDAAWAWVAPVLPATRTGAIGEAIEAAAAGQFGRLHKEALDDSSI